MTRLRKSLYLMLIAAAIFFLARLLLLVTYSDYFSALSSEQILSAFLHGLRFDLSIITLSFFGPLLFMNVSFKFGNHRWWFDAIAWLLFGLTLAMALLLAADTLYFGFVHRHIGSELVTISGDMDFVIQLAFYEYLHWILLFLLFSSGLFFLWRRILNPRSIDNPYPLLTLVLLTLVSVILYRGGETSNHFSFFKLIVSGKPINVIDAYASGSTVEGNLVLNGVFSALHTSRNSDVIDYDYFPPDRMTQLLNHSPGVDAEYPALKRYNSKPTGKNIVLILLESWGADYVDSFGGQDLGVTPEFDTLSNKGLKFNRFYASAQRSSEGVQAVLTGIPKIVGVPVLGKGLEIINFTRLGNLAAQHGYDTLFTQSSSSSSMRMNAIAGALGFENYISKEDISRILDYPDPNPPLYGWDYETFMAAKERMDKMDKPFLSVIFTGSTHTPYLEVPEKFRKYDSADSMNLGGFLNALSYADWCLGEFMRQASNSPWFDDTIFLITADHAMNKYMDHPNLEQQFHIPFLIYAPKHIKPDERDIVGSHLDILPTVIDLLGFADGFAAFGESLLKKDQDYAFVTTDGNVFGLITSDGYVSRTHSNRLESATFDAGKNADLLNQLDDKLLASIQFTYQLIHENRLLPKK